MEQLSFPARGVEGPGPYSGDRILRRQVKYEESVEPDFPSVGGDEVESLSGEPAEGDTSDSGEDEEQEE